MKKKNIRFGHDQNIVDDTMLFDKLFVQNKGVALRLILDQDVVVMKFILVGDDSRPLPLYSSQTQVKSEKHA